MLQIYVTDSSTWAKAKAKKNFFRILITAKNDLSIFSLVEGTAKEKKSTQKKNKSN